jgi:hypothetical protein
MTQEDCPRSSHEIEVLSKILLVIWIQRFN